MSTQSKVPSMSALKRSSGAYAMLAIDQRESLRAMFTEARGTAVRDDEIVQFKLNALKALSPLASAVLIDQDFAWQPAIEQDVVSSDCGLIAAVDRFSGDAGEIVSRSVIDDRSNFDLLRQQGAQALKLLVIWRPDESPEERLAMVHEFVGRCRAAGLLSIIEPVSRKARSGQKTDLQAGILAAAKELGRSGQDLYKAEMPLHGEGSETEIRSRCAELHTEIGSPWVILSAGVRPENFPRAVGLSCKEGAEGFLAGRAVWKDSLAAEDVAASLRTDAADRLRRLCDVADEAMVNRLK